MGRRPDVPKYKIKIIRGFRYRRGRRLDVPKCKIKIII